MFHCLPNSAWADGNLAERAGQVGKMVEHRNPNPGPRPVEPLCNTDVEDIRGRGVDVQFYGLYDPSCGGEQEIVRSCPRLNAGSDT